ncbi:MAG: HAD family phosphatase [Solirubrobacterales bacterium]|nr:HAD family phosphatase [Solirubrobacterales bacterium]
MALKAVIFDIGGVLEVNPATGWQQRWARQLSIDTTELGRRLSGIWAAGEVGRSTLDEIERRTAQALNLDAEQIHALTADVWAEYVGTLNQDLAQYLESLRPRFKTAALSNSFVGAREREEAAHRFSERFDVIVYSHEEGCLKPDPRIYRTACDRLGVSPEKAVLVDDVQANVDGARAVGMHGLRSIDNEQAMRELSSCVG